MGPGVCTSKTFLKLCWCDSVWWWYQLNTIDDAIIKQSLAIRNQFWRLVILLEMMLEVVLGVMDLEVVADEKDDEKVVE